MDREHAVTRARREMSLVRARGGGGAAPRALASRRHVWALLVGLGVAAGLYLPALAQVVELTVHPAMVRGPADAPVTIVEFADYQ
jgi:hypothetical protein